MEFTEINNRAKEIREKYKTYELKVLGTPWSYLEQTQGLVVDTGEFMELIMAKSGVRKYKGENLDSAIGHELSDILWGVLTISNELNIDLEKEFTANMNVLESKIDLQISKEK